MKDEEKTIVGFEDNFKIGIAWEGNPNHSNNHDRCCPLGVFRKLHDMPNTKLFMIQPKIQNEKLIEGSSDLEIFGTEVTDFKSTAKLLNSLDVIVSVDTAVMHLAGALGKRTYCLLSHNHDPRWDLDINWYPTVKFIKQKFAGDWLGSASEINMHVGMDRQKWSIKNPSKS
jgi:ADP-heptose:LPS heptosyltransferase